ncbi:hypothetical protein L6164_009646 [Bauhinia variegata]|uniref:Uncharacterized protein n=1 Tax=Bauhinia variegata TaxID=167791 RepID=A0ACB9PKL0_BAUVA|nr:hypothetical protein L6164_009646 [Bauhinia variegata]
MTKDMPFFNIIMVRVIFCLNIVLSKTLEKPIVKKQIKKLAVVCGCSSTAMAERISWYCAVFLALMLVLSCCESSKGELAIQILQPEDMKKHCDEIYVVREGETLQTISEKCGDPYIVEENPHIHDPDDVFPGLVIKINPFSHTR